MITRYDEAYDRFASLNDTDKEKIDANFEKNLSWFEDVIRNVYGDTRYGEELAYMRDIYQSIWEVIKDDG